ncbi:hypothetical protein IAU60_003852 [Kwoniella sp. DSM 27419]
MSANMSYTPTSSACPSNHSSPSTSTMQISDSPPLSPRYTLSQDYVHLVDEPGMERVIAQKIALLQNTLANLSQDALRQARADITYLRSVLQGEEPMIAQCRAGAVFSAEV